LAKADCALLLLPSVKTDGNETLSLPIYLAKADCALLLLPSVKTDGNETLSLPLASANGPK